MHFSLVAFIIDSRLRHCAPSDNGITSKVCPSQRWHQDRRQCINRNHHLGGLAGGFVLDWLPLCFSLPTTRELSAL